MAGRSGPKASRIQENISSSEITETRSAAYSASI
jgi:hypothetical protein